MAALLIIILALLLGGGKLLMLIAYIYGVIQAFHQNILLGVLALLIPPVAIIVAVLALLGFRG